MTPGSIKDSQDTFEFDISAYLKIFQRRKWHILIPISVIWTMLIFAGFFIPDKYGAKAILMIQDEQTDSPLLKGMALPSSVANRMSIIRKTIFSPGSIRKAVDMLTADSVLAKRLSRAEMELLISGVTLTTVTRSKSYRNKDLIMELTCIGSDSLAVARVINVVIDVFIEETLFPQRNAASSVINFLGKQMQLYEERMDSADARLSRFKRAHLYALPGALDFNLKKVIELETALAETDIQLAEIERQQNHLANQLTTNNQALSDKRAELANLTVRYTNHHPRVIELKAEIAELEKGLKHQRQKLLDRGTFNYNLIIGNPKVSDDYAMLMDYMNRTRLNTRSENVLSNASDDVLPQGQALIQNQFLSPQQLERFKSYDPYTLLIFSDLSKFKDLEIRKETLQTRKKEINKQTVRFNQQLQSIPKQEQTLLQLKRDQEVTQIIYDNMFKKLEDAKVTKDLELTNELTRFRILRKPEVPHEPISANQIKIIFGGILAGIFMGIGFAVFAEFFDPNIKSEKDIVQRLGLKNLITLDYLEDERFRAIDNFLIKSE